MLGSFEIKMFIFHFQVVWALFNETWILYTYVTEEVAR